MAEGPSNVEIAHHVHELGTGGSRHSRRVEFAIEIGEALLLALVAIATAWSGYQAVRWDGHEAKLYGDSSRLNFGANAANTLAGQKQLYNGTTVNAWLQAKLTGNDRLAHQFEMRFTPEFRPAFKAWLRMDPLHNPDAPAGPMFTPQYRNRSAEEARALNKKASEVFDEGTSARHHGEEYVRATVFLATVLFLIALSQRFDLFAVRVGILGVALVLLLLVLGSLISYPRLL
jgi:hypothetical protein